MAHPIRPESYIAMDNFYTVTVYNKGAEVTPPPSRRPAPQDAAGRVARDGGEGYGTKGRGGALRAEGRQKWPPGGRGWRQLESTGARVEDRRAGEATKESISWP